MRQTISRRNFLKASRLMAAWAALAACGPKTGLFSTATGTPVAGTAEPIVTTTGATATAGLATAGPVPSVTATTAAASGLEGEALLAHVLRRLTFGAGPDMVENARSLGVEAFIEEQLNPDGLSDSQVDALMGRFSTLSMSAQERFALPQQGQAAQELTAATLLRQVYSQRQLYELVVDFWTNHFNIFIGKNACRFLKTDDDLQVIRPNALGSFTNLLNASAHSPAMLIYLDQAESSGSVPNENYARELLELHTISTAANYTQDDIIDVARAFTGWTVIGQRGMAADAGGFVFRTQLHDDGEKDLLGLHLPAGQGEGDGEQVLALLAQHPLAARFISTKLARRFVADQPPATLVDSLAARFTQTGGDIRQVLRTLFASPEFRSTAAQKFKRPLEFFISALRLTGATIQGQGQSRALVAQLQQMGQVPFQWSPPNGYPDVAGYWASTSGLLNRWNFGMLLTSNLLKGARVDLNTLTRDAGSPADVVDVLSLRFTGEILPPDAREIVLNFAAAGDLGANLAPVAGLILGSPHFQMR